jgi:hypothetical protein
MDEPNLAYGAESAAKPGRIAKAPVSVRAVIGRINRKLAKEKQTLHKARDGSQIGPYFIVQDRTSSVIAHGINDIEQLARDKGALRAWEELTP